MYNGQKFYQTKKKKIEIEIEIEIEKKTEPGYSGTK